VGILTNEGELAQYGLHIQIVDGGGRDSVWVEVNVHV